MTGPDDNDHAPHCEPSTTPAVVPEVTSKDINPNSSDHYDVIIEVEQGGDPDRVHVTSILPRVRQ